MKIININNREKNKGKERRKKITDLFSLVCELEGAEFSQFSKKLPLERGLYSPPRIPRGVRAVRGLS